MVSARRAHHGPHISDTAVADATGLEQRGVLLLEGLLHATAPGQQPAAVETVRRLRCHTEQSERCQWHAGSSCSRMGWENHSRPDELESSVAEGTADPPNLLLQRPWRNQRAH